MKWFFKALRHYADFSGRARRKEYWMFALFHFLFLLVWMFVISLFASASGGYDEKATPMLVLMSVSIMLGLPGLALSVRRLHDLGKSGWMMLLGLIPGVGTIWLFVLMVTDGKRGANLYGPDPKTTPELYTDRAKLTSVGTALVVASAVSLLTGLVPGQMGLYTLFSVLVDAMLLTAGILLLNSGERKKARSALMVLMIGALIIFLRGLSGWTNIGMILEHGSGRIVVNIVLYPLFYLAVAGFTAALLFAKNPKLVRNAGLAVIVLAGLSLLWQAVMLSRFGESGYRWEALSLFAFLNPIVFILLAWTFLSKVGQPAVAASPETGAGYATYEADQKVVYRPSTPKNSAGPAPGGGSGKGLGWKIFGLFVSIGLIIGGASGELVLRGTDSSGALIVFGVIFLIGDIIALATHNKSGKRKQAYEEQLAEGAITQVELSGPATIRVVRDSSIVGAIISYQVHLNHDFVGKIGNGKVLDIQTSVSHNIITVYDNQGNAFSGEFTADLEAGGYAEVHVKAGRFVKG